MDELEGLKGAGITYSVREKETQGCLLVRTERKQI